MEGFVHNNTGKKQHDEPEKAVLAGLIYRDQTEDRLNEYLDELEFLAQTAGAVVLKRFKQRLEHPDRNTFVGKGKLEEIQQYVTDKAVDLVIFDDDLSPRQQSILEKELKCKVIDRSYLILDIFASRARTAQAKAQVELAQMQYLLPRLKGLWSHLERQRGGIGMRGPGEQEMETDRRIVKDRIASLKKQLAKIDTQNTVMRKRRGELIRVALIGYTNVGKSTIMNLLSKSEVFAENKLFATLDTTVRKIVYDNTAFLLSDTVGFIRKLPHDLIESFKSTLDEVRESDILIHVADISHPQFEDQIAVVNNTLKEIGVSDKPVITVFNKTDLYTQRNFDTYLPEVTKQEILQEFMQQWTEKIQGPSVFISATERQNIEEFRAKLLDMVKEQYLIRYPYQSPHY